MGPLKLLLILGSIQYTFCYKCPPSGSSTATNPVLPTKYIDPGDPDCKKYFICDKVTTTVDEVIHRTCPGTTRYHNDRKICLSNIACSNTAACKEPGRFPNNSVPGCKGYRLCVLNDDQTYQEYLYTCPTTTVFSPSAQSCTTTYTCVEPTLQ